MAGAKIALSSTTGELKNDGQSNALFNTPGNSSAGVAVGGGTANAGFMSLLSEVDAGTVLGERTVRELEASDDFRLRVATDTLQYSQSFEGTNIARDRIQQNDTTMTAAQASGVLSINSSGVTASGNACNIRTYRTFPLYGSYTTHCHMWIRESNETATNAVSEYGLGYATGVTAPSDGVFLRRLSGGALQGVICFNPTGAAPTETTVSLTMTNVPSRTGVGSYSPSEINHWIIYMHNNVTRFWCNNIQVGYKKTPSTQGTGNTTSSAPFFARVYNSGIASSARKLDLAYLSINSADLASSKPFGHAASAFGGSSVQIQPGTVSGPTVSRGAGSTGWPTSATARVAGTWTATSAPALNSLGGQWVSPAISTLTSEADYPVFCYINPLGTAILPGKTLYITHVRFGKTVALTAAATNSINLNYIIGVGATTAVTNGTEAPALIAARGLVLDTIPFKATAAIGDFVEGSEIDFSQAPLVIYPGCNIQFIVRPFGTVTSNTLTLAGSVMFSGYFE